MEGNSLEHRGLRRAPEDTRTPRGGGGLLLGVLALEVFEVADGRRCAAVRVREALGALALGARAAWCARRAVGVHRTLRALRTRRVADRLARAAVGVRPAAEAHAGGRVALRLVAVTSATTGAGHATLAVLRIAGGRSDAAVAVGPTRRAFSSEAEGLTGPAVGVVHALHAAEDRVALPAAAGARGRGVARDPAPSARRRDPRVPGASARDDERRRERQSYTRAHEFDKHHWRVPEAEDNQSIRRKIGGRATANEREGEPQLPVASPIAPGPL